MSIPEKTKNRLEVRRMSDVEVKPIEWAWHNRIVKDSLNLILGKEGIGKGTLMAYLLSRWTLGKVEGSMLAHPCNVAIVGNEDSYERVWTPRVMAAQGNTDRIFDIKWKDFRQIDIHRDISSLGRMVHRYDIKVLYFDAFLDNLSGEVSAADPKQVGDALAPLRVLSDELGVTSIATLHPNKRGSTFRELQQMSAKFTGVSRSSLLLAEHPDDPEYRVVALGKGNYVSNSEVESRQFRILSENIRVKRELIRTSRVGGLEYSPLGIMELIEAAGSGRRGAGAGGRDTKLDEIEKILKTVLSSGKGKGEWHPAREAYDACEEHGYDVRRTIRKARERLKVEIMKEDEMGGSWYWRLPQ